MTSPSRKAVKMSEAPPLLTLHAFIVWTKTTFCYPPLLSPPHSYPSSLFHCLLRSSLYQYHLVLRLFVLPRRCSCTFLSNFGAIQQQMWHFIRGGRDLLSLLLSHFTVLIQYNLFHNFAIYFLKICFTNSPPIANSSNPYSSI